MNNINLLMSIGSFVAVIGTWILYLRTVSKVQVKVKPTGIIIAQWAGLILAVATAIATVSSEELASVAVLIPAAFAFVMSSAFLLFYAVRKLPVGDLKVKPGDTILPFSATTSEGVPFHSDELAGKRILLKFFRGGW